MASEPSSAREVGKRMSSASIAVIVMTIVFALHVRASRRVHPEHRLSYEEIPNHFLDRRVRGQTLPKLYVFGATEGKPREQKTTLAHRPLAVVHHVGPQRPIFLVADERHNELQGPAHPTTVRQLEHPEIVFRRREYPADGRHRFEVEERVAIWLRALQLLREAPVRRQLVRHEHSLEACAAVVEQFPIPRQVREGRDLHHPARAVVVLRVALLYAVPAGRHPL